MSEPKKLRSLDEFNADRRDVITLLEAARRNTNPNGIACPNCGTELMDTDPLTTLTSNPPQKNIHCPSCDYRGYRIA